MINVGCVILDEVVVSERIDKIVYGTWWFLMGLFFGCFIWIIPFIILIFIPFILLPFTLFSWYGVFIYGSLFSATIVYVVLRLAKIEKYKIALAIIGTVLASSTVPYMFMLSIIHFFTI